MLQAQRENSGQREGCSKVQYSLHKRNIKLLQTETIVLLNEFSLKL